MLFQLTCNFRIFMSTSVNSMNNIKCVSLEFFSLINFKLIVVSHMKFIYIKIYNIS